MARIADATRTHVRGPGVSHGRDLGRSRTRRPAETPRAAAAGIGTTSPGAANAGRGRRARVGRRGKVDGRRRIDYPRDLERTRRTDEGRTELPRRQRWVTRGAHHDDEKLTRTYVAGAAMAGTAAGSASRRAGRRAASASARRTRTSRRRRGIPMWGYGARHDKLSRGHSRPAHGPGDRHRGRRRQGRHRRHRPRPRTDRGDDDRPFARRSPRRPASATS